MKMLWISLAFMLDIAVKLHLVVGYDLPLTFPYTLQATPISFTKEPESSFVLSGTIFSLICNTTILPSNNYRLPELMWRYNGQLLTESHPAYSYFHISTFPDNSRSELKIMEVSQKHSGYYECIILDGYHLEGEEEAFVNILVSQRALVKVVDVDQIVSEEVEAVSVVLGQHLLLPCETGVAFPPAQTVWRKDGHVLTGMENIILGNGTLLILEATMEVEGSYQCTGYYNQEPLNSTTYNVTIAHAIEGVTDLASPVVIVDGPPGIVQPGARLNLTCYFLNSDESQLQWLKDGILLSETENLLTIEAAVRNSGSYTCQLISSSGVLGTSDFNLIIASKPVVEIGGCNRIDIAQLCNDDTIWTDSVFERTIQLTCNTYDPLATIYWYKNGQNITSYSRAHTLAYTGDNPDDLLGVYQCFAETTTGMGYDTIRVIGNGFTNPPANFKCQAVDQMLNIAHPAVILSWEQPTLQAYQFGRSNVMLSSMTGSYVIVYEVDGANHSTTVGMDTTTVFIDLPRDGQYTFWVYFNHSYPRTAIATCENNTFIRRRTPRRMVVSCPESLPTGDHSDANISIPVQWTSPVKQPYISFIITVHLESVCLQNNITQQDTLLDEFGLREADQVFNLKVGPLLPGTVCLFGGFYKLFGEFATRIPSDGCGVPEPQSTAKAKLELTCFDSVAAVEVIIPGRDTTLISTDIGGKCVIVDFVSRPVRSVERYLEPGNTSISGLPTDTICSFYGSYQLQTSEVLDFEPVLCIMNHPPPPTISLPTTTAKDVTPTTSISSSTSDTTSSGSSISVTSSKSITTPEGSTLTISSAAITWIAVDLSLALLVIFSLLVACFAWKSYSKTLTKERKKRLHIWDDLLTQQEGEDSLDQDPHILPQFPYCTPHVPDALSIATTVDYLYQEEGRVILSHTSLSSLMKSMKNDEKAVESPQLIMDRFLNGCHQRVWKSSYESLSNVPPPSAQVQGDSQPSKQQRAETNATCEDTHLVTCNSNLESVSEAQHYTLPLQVDVSNQLVVDSYIPSGESSGYGTSSDHYFESVSSTYTSSTSDYFKSRLADVAECNSLSTCEEEGQQTSVVDIMKYSKDSCNCPMLACEISCDYEVTPHGNVHTNKNHLRGRPNRTPVMILPVNTNSYGSTSRQTAGLSNSGVKTNINYHRDYTPSSVPPEHYFTDDEGYLRFSEENT